MSKILHLFIGLIFLFFAGCKQKYLNYPYAENNTTIEIYNGFQVSDDYKWLESNPENNKLTKKWIKEEEELCTEYFKSRKNTIKNRIEELASSEHYIMIKSDNDTLYYAGIFPYSNQLNIYKHNPENKKNSLLKHFNLPFQINYDLNALVLRNGEYIAMIGANKHSINSLYIYNLTDNSPNPLTTIKHVVDRPLNRIDNGFLFVKDIFEVENIYSGANSLNKCVYSNNESFPFVYNEIFRDENIYNKYIFDSAYDFETKDIYIGRYASEFKTEYEILSIIEKEDMPHVKLSISSPKGEVLRLAGSDDVNFYIIAVEGDLKGTLYAINKKTHKKEVVIRNTFMNVQDFALIKDHAIIHYKKENENRAYLIHKHSLLVDELPLKDQLSYKFYRNQNFEKIYFQAESLINPKDIYKINPADLKNTKKITERVSLPYNPDDYKIEHVTYLTESGDEVKLQLTYKRGIKKDGSNPLLLMTFLNAENSFLDMFYLARILYMDHGFIFVQTAKSESKHKNQEDRAKRIHTSLEFLIKENYTSENKIALLGREYGATAVMQFLNNHERIKPPVVLMDGIYDLFGQNQKEELNYSENNMFTVNSMHKMKDLVHKSPYHNVKVKKNYPPVLLMTSPEHKIITKSETYKMTAKLQMRTRGYNPIIMLSPDQKNEMIEYSYKNYIEYAFCFLSRNMNIDYI